MFVKRISAFLDSSARKRNDAHTKYISTMRVSKAKLTCQSTVGNTKIIFPSDQNFWF